MHHEGSAERAVSSHPRPGRRERFGASRTRTHANPDPARIAANANHGNARPGPGPRDFEQNFAERGEVAPQSPSHRANSLRPWDGYQDAARSARDPRHIVNVWRSAKLHTPSAPASVEKGRVEIDAPVARSWPECPGRKKPGPCAPHGPPRRPKAVNIAPAGYNLPTGRHVRSPRRQSHWWSRQNFGTTPTPTALSSEYRR